MDRRAWHATIHGVAKSQTELSNQHFTSCPFKVYLSFICLQAQCLLGYILRVLVFHFICAHCGNIWGGCCMSDTALRNGAGELGDNNGITATSCVQDLWGKNNCATKFREFPTRR